MYEPGLRAVRPDGAVQAPRPRVFLFLQGPVSPFFARLATALEVLGHRTVRVNLCFGDWLFWRRPGAINFRDGPEAWPAFVEKVIDEQRVTDLILLGEERYYHKEAIRLARARGIQVVVTDFGYLRPGWLTFEKDGMSGASRFPRHPQAIRSLARQAEAREIYKGHRNSFPILATWELIHNLLTALMRPLYPGYRTHHLAHPVLADAGISAQLWMRHLWRNRAADRVVARTIAAGTRFYLFPLQVRGDYQIRAYSPYDGLEQPIREVIGSFARSAPAQSRLLIKVHPFDPAFDGWFRLVRDTAAAAGVGERVSYLYGGALKPMIAASAGVVTVNSTVGLQAVRAGRPVKVLGQAIYDVPGLTFQGDLDRFWTEAPPPDPAFGSDFVRALAATVHIRGDFYGQPGLDVAVAEAAERLDQGLVNVPWPQAEAVPGCHRAAAAAGR